MRKLTQDEYDILIRIAAYGREGSVWFYGMEPELHTVLHSLIRKKRLTADTMDGVTKYQLTAQGWQDAA